MESNGRHMLLTDNSKTNFMCGYESKPIGNSGLISQNKEILDFNKVDYMINNHMDEPEPETNADFIYDTKKDMENKQKTLSYLSVKSVEEGINWYKQEFPMIPDELLPLMSRWNFGNLNEETKKSIKNNIKKLKKKTKKESIKFSIEHKPVLISFD